MQGELGGRNTVAWNADRLATQMRVKKYVFPKTICTN
jgi:hypothetical protein